jgi:[CysO sulfur-carrier protein]-S-L-cysteine hydrolase
MSVLSLKSNDVNACAAYLMVMTLHIPEAMYEEMVQHARAELPNECVGMLIGTKAGSAGQVHEYLPLVNELQSPTRFFTEPRSMLRAEKRCRERKLDVLAIFHSHPTSQPIPSRYDVADHYSSEVMCLIISLEKETIALEGWWIREGQFSKADVVIDPTTN